MQLTLATSKVIKQCSLCLSDIAMYPSRANRATIFFCNKACHRTYKNKISNPSWTRDITGINNPMFGKHPIAWNKGMKGAECFNWRGGIHSRGDGYVRINIDGNRLLYHRYLLSKVGADIAGKVVHHIDHNPSNNELANFMIFNTQSEHVKYEHANPVT